MEGYVLHWWERDEYSESRGDIQAEADTRDTSGIDLATSTKSISEMLASPLGEPPSEFDVRCIFDSRPVNGFDFNLGQSIVAGLNSLSGVFTATFVCPAGYRVVPRKWEIFIENPPPGSIINSTVSLLNNGAAVPFNQNIVIGSGGVVETFFLVEENSTFGLVGTNTNLVSGNSNIVVNVYGNLLPVTDVALPFEVANRVRQQ